MFSAAFLNFAFPLQEGGVVALFKVCRQDCFRCLYPQTLRTLASICCVEEGMHQLEKVGTSVFLTDCHKTEKSCL